jgi:AraC-like DNA-binding protein/ligand-binding sensor protein
MAEDDSTHSNGGSVARDPPRTAEARPLEAFLKVMETLTGLQICIYDLKFFLNESPNLTVPRRLRIHSCSYCQFIKSNPEAYARCIKTENWRTARAGMAGAPILHTCHAGVTDLIVPVFNGGTQMGAVFLGQALSGNDRAIQTRLNKLSAAYGYKREDLEKAASQMRRISTGDLRKVQPVASAIADYLEQAERLAALQGESDYWAHTQQAYESLPSGNISLEQLPTPALDRIRSAVHNDEDRRILKSLDLIRAAYHKAPSCQEMSRAVGMSQSHFSREFRRATGMTYRQCLLECRLNAAFYLIKRYRLTIEEAGVVVGYGDGCALQRAFKMFMGMTPHQFLRRYPRAFMLERFETNEKVDHRRS